MYWSIFFIAYGLRSKTHDSQPGSPGHQPEKQTEITPEDKPEEEWILCRQCRQRLSRPSESTIVNGAHQHTFANPSGIVFEIVCYRNVRGCRPAGSPSTDFSWFSGHAWQIVFCSRCLTHLGWHFSSNIGTHFYGLILDRIKRETLSSD